MKKRFYFLIFIKLILFSDFVFAQNENDTIAKELKIDRNENIQSIPFEQGKIERYKNSKDFDYSRELAQEDWWLNFKIWLNNLWDAFWRKFFEAFVPNDVSPVVVEFIKYGFIILFIAFAVWLFIRLNPGKAWVKAAKRPDILFSEDDRIIRTEDIPSLIRKAETDRNYRLALRYYYLLILKSLKDAKLIDYKVDKTNQEYKKELESTDLKEQFNTITHLYDFIWYGNFELEKNEYFHAKTVFEEVELKIKNRKQ